MYNQVQGTYPQLAGSFYNSGGMMPHDNGRTAQQVPTFFGGLQNMMSASTAMTNYQNIPLGQSILRTQGSAGDLYMRSLSGVGSGIATGLTAATGIAGLGALFSSNSALGMIGGPLGLAAAGLGSTVISGYNKRMQEIENMRSVMAGSRLGHGLTNPMTGQLTNQAALDISDRMRMSAAGAGFKSNDFNKIMGSASNLGMLNGMSSISEVTKKVTDLAKASRDIVMLGEGISMQDAMHLQKLTQDMGVSTAKFKGMNLGKNLVAAARAANMSMDQAAQLGGQGAMTFQQMGFGAAAGMNAAFYTNTAANALSMTGNLSQRQLAAFGGVQGLGQSLMAGQAGTLSRFSDAMIMGAVKLTDAGNLRLDRELLDRYVRGDVTTKDLISRGKSLGKGLSKSDRNAVLEQLRFSMPELREGLGDMLSSEELMAVQGREILNLRKKTGLSMRMAAHSYFGESNQAEAFLNYSQNYGAVSAENRRQRRISNQEEMLRYAGMAKSSSGFARAGRAVGKAFSDLGNFVVEDGLGIGKALADSMAEYSDRVNRGATAMFAHDLDYSTDNLSASILRRGRRGLAANSSISYKDLLESTDLETYRKITGAGEMMEFGSTGLYSRLMQVYQGDRSIKGIGEMLGIDTLNKQEERSFYEAQASITDNVTKMSRIMGTNRSFDYTNSKQRTAYQTIVNHLMAKSKEVAKGSSKTGDFHHVLPKHILNNLVEDSPESRQALAEAYRYMQEHAPAEERAGYSKMLEGIQGVASLRATVSSSAAIDELQIGGSVIASKGLSAALQNSGINTNDLNKLVQYMSSQGHKLPQDGAAPSSLQYILNQAGVNTSRAGRYAGVIAALKGARVRSGKGKDAREVDLSGAQIKFEEGVKASDLRGSTDAYVQKQLKKLDASISAGLGGYAAGTGFREDLLYLMGKEKPLTEEQRGVMGTQAFAVATSRVDTELAEYDKYSSEIKTMTDQLFGGEGGLGNLKIGFDLDKKQKQRKKLLKNLESKGYRFDASGNIMNKDEVLRKRQTQAFENMSENLGRDVGERQLFAREGGFSNLSEVIDYMAGTDEEKQKAYGTLKDSKSFAALQTDYLSLQAKVQAGTMDQNQAQDKLLEKLTKAIVDTGNKDIIKGKGSKPLPEILGQISLGLETFNKHLGAIATQAATSPVEIKINSSSSKAKSKE